MRIWLLNHYATPPGGTGGGRHALLAKYLARKGHEVVVFPSAFGHKSRGSVEVPEGRLFVDRAYGEVRFRFVRTLPYGGRVRRLLNTLSYGVHVRRSTAGLGRPDVVVGSSVHLSAAEAGLAIARRYGVPFVLEIRDVWPETLVDIGALSRRHPVYAYFRWMERRLYRNADAVIALFAGAVPYLEREGVRADRIRLIPNGVDPEMYPAAIPPAPPDDPFVVSYFGGHAPAYALDVALRAAALLQDRKEGAGIRLRFVGGGESRESLLRLAEQLRLRNVEFLGWVPRADLVPLAASSHAFLFNLRDLNVFRRYGISPSKLADYLMSGRPILFACRSFNNPVEEAGAGVSVEPENPAALAEAILRLRGLPAAERGDMGARGRAWALEHCDFRKLADRLEALFLEVSARAP